MPAKRSNAFVYSAVLLLGGTGFLPVHEADAHLVPLIYHGRPLPEVIEDIQPYTRRHIVIDAAAAEFQYSGIVKQEDVDAWIRDLPAIYPVTVIDCRSARYRIDLPACTDPTLIVIRSRLNLYQNSLRSALR